MRYLFGFLCVCALGLMGCSEECQYPKDCDDRNVCTDNHCEFSSGTCIYMPVNDGIECDFDGVPGACIDGVCGEDICQEVVCDDGDECTVDLCDFVDGCYFLPEPDGTSCDWSGEPGVCIDGVCEEDPCKGVVCDDDDLCTNDRCVRTTGECEFSPVPCRDRSCAYGSCDPDTGECVYTPVPDGTDCCVTWLIFCFDPGTCQNGRCV